MTGAVLTAAAAAAAVMVASTGTAVPGGPRAAAHPGPAALSARQILLTAATAAAARPEGSGTYWDVRTITSAGGFRETDETWTLRDGGTTWVWAGKKTHDRIIKLYSSGTGWWLMGGTGSLTPVPHPSRGITGWASSGWVSFGQLQRLPTSPAALKARIAALTRNIPGGNWDFPGQVAVFNPLTQLVMGLPVPPQVRAAAFRALATLPNVTSLGPVDGGQGLRFSMGGRPYATLVLDLATSQVRDVVSFSGPQKGSSVSVTARWVNRLP